MTSGFVNYGASTLNFFLPTVIINSFNLTPNWNENYLVQSNFNVSTAFPEIYLDFGVLGLILFSIFISYFGNKLYRNLKKDLSDKNILMFAVYIHNIIFIFFVNMFLYIPIFFQFIFIPLIFREEDSFGKDECNSTNL